MDKVARLPAEQRRDLFSQTAGKMNLRPALIEKDFWVCWTLKRIFSIPHFRSHLLFKGGTTLSKIFGVTRRFSEDIDLAVDWEMLGFSGERSPLADMSTTKRNKLIAEMLEKCRGYISTDFIETLHARIAEELPDSESWQLVIDQDERGVINFNFPIATEELHYVLPEVRLELGTHAEFLPNDRFSIRPYAAEHFPDVFEDAVCAVRALNAERTFWEKATILHQEHHRTIDRGPPTRLSRLSRHYYDVCMLADDDDIVQKALSSSELLARVVEHKIRFYPRAWARYDLAVPDTLQLLPSTDWIDFLRQDYESMKIMLFGETPSFDDILARLADLEKSIRKMRQPRTT